MGSEMCIRDSPETALLCLPAAAGHHLYYMGVEVNDRAEILMQDGRPATNLYAAGEIMAGNILGQGYLAGIGMTIGAVFGRIAGEQAARRLNRVTAGDTS